MPDLNCIICDNFKIVKKIISYDYENPIEFYKCECGYTCQYPVPTNYDLEKFYKGNQFTRNTNKKKIIGFGNYFEEKKNKIKTSEYRINQINKIDQYILQNKRVLKFGCGDGNFLYLLRKRGITKKAYGCDFSELADFGIKNRQRIIKKDFNKITIKPNSIDTFIFFNVIENIPDICNFFNKLQTIIKKDGVIIFNSFDLDSFITNIFGNKLYLYRPPVCHVFTEKSLLKYLSKNNFTIVSIIKDKRYMSLDKILGLINYPISKLVKKFSLKINFFLDVFPSKIYILKKN